jgi:CDP-diacylglycerol--glycerol-3-phosphate 3-phosphatidyltransferase
MAAEAKTGDAKQPTIWTVPNQITMVRILLSIALFVALHFQWYGPALALFVLAAGTDWLDGYLARKHNLVTQLGRVLDPLADKIIICGTFIFLSSAPGSCIPAWMTVVVVARELGVTVIRSFLEQHGKDFSASMPGKLKMVFQCAAAIASIWLLREIQVNQVNSWLPQVVTALAWIATLATIYSGGLYLIPAARLFREI